MTYGGMIWLGGSLLVVGWLLLFAAVINLIAKSFLLAFFAVMFIMIGFFVGIFGVLGIYRANRER